MSFQGNISYGNLLLITHAVSSRPERDSFIVPRSGETRSLFAEAKMREHLYYVYIMASRSRTLYIGFTSDIEVRGKQHKAGVYDGFSKTYQCHSLVYFERFGEVYEAIAREKQLKRWSRAKKIWLIEQKNPAWADLSEVWGNPVPTFAELNPGL